MLNNKNQPLITDIKRHSHDDGPGIRSVVFFKGCPLHCIFCHNPETQDPDVEIAFYEQKCIQCGECVEACPENAVDLNHPGRILRDRCNRCGDCAEVCPDGALKVIGEYYPVNLLTEILLKDYSYYVHSGGGVTLTGGECTLYPDYLEALLRSLKNHEIHVIIETNGCFNYDTFKERILPYVDIIYFDIKFARPELHKKYTGVSNYRIIANYAQLQRESGVEIYPRIPLVPKVTATRENLSAIVRILCGTGAENVTLLPYNPLGLSKTENFGREKPDLPENFMKPEEEEKICSMFSDIIRKNNCVPIDSRN